MAPHWKTPAIHKKQGYDRERLDQFAAEALSFLAGDHERLRRFLDTTGLAVDGLRQAAAAPDFAASLLDYLAADDRCLAAFAAESGRDLAELDRMRLTLTPPRGAD